MGLDWNPGPKAKEGFEREFLELWRKLHSKSCFWRQKKVARFKEITSEAFSTIAAPRVGRDRNADDWVRAQYPKRVDKTLSEDTWLERFQGFYVVDLVPPCDGITRYTNGSAGGYVERFSFRGQFLKDCTDILGSEILESAWVSKLPADTKTYGDQLTDCARNYARREGIDLAGVVSPEDPDSKEFHLDVVLAAGRWCRFWAERGHWLEAYF